MPGEGEPATSFTIQVICVTCAADSQSLVEIELLSGAPAAVAPFSSEGTAGDSVDSTGSGSSGLGDSGTSGEIEASVDDVVISLTIVSEEDDNPAAVTRVASAATSREGSLMVELSFWPAASA